jgi:hypothetical protein
MVLYIVCIVFTGISNMVTTPPQFGQAYSRQQCTLYETLNDAAVAEYKRTQLRVSDGLGTRWFSEPEGSVAHFYKVDVESKTMTEIKAPTVRLEIDEASNAR